MKKESIKVVGCAKQPKKEKIAPKKNQKLEATHSQMCITICDYMRTKHLDKLFIHIANEGKRSPQQGKKLKDEGMMPGVYDYLLCYHTVEFVGDGNHLFIPGLFVEVKAKKDKLSKAQKEFREKALDAHYGVAEVWSIDEFINIIEEYVKPKGIQEYFDSNKQVD